MDVTPSEYVAFDMAVATSEPAIDQMRVDWRQRSREDAIKHVLSSHEDKKYRS